MDHSTADYKTVRSLLRGLDILQALNRCQLGRATSTELAQMTGLHRTTVRRLLETLIDAGYVRRSDSDDSFRLALKVRELSEGFTDAEWVCSIASPIMGKLLHQVVWPCDLSTPSGAVMQIRETTHRFSPLSFHRAMVGRRLPMLLTASGRSYFAHCADEERAAILQLLRKGDDEQAQLARDTHYVDNLIRKVRAAGYGSNDGEWVIPPFLAIARSRNAMRPWPAAVLG